MRACNVIVEVTRRCNMECLHCLRGNPQPVKMQEKYVRYFLQNFEYISTITLTGGEPSLPSGMDGIDLVIEALRGWHIDLGNFYIATNGKRITDRFVAQLRHLYFMCSDNEVSRVDLSNDKYHDRCSSWVPDKLDSLNYELAEDLVGVKTPTSSRFVWEATLLNQGRAETNQLGQKDYDGEEILWKVSEYDEDVFETSEGSLYLNCRGNVIRGCDFSYIDQDKPENILCRYDTGDLERVIREKGVKAD